MSNNYMTQGIQTFKKYVMMLVLVLTGTMAANAADVIDLGVLETNKGYSIDSKALYKGSFTAPEEGTLVVQSSNYDLLQPYNDEGLTDRINYTFLRDNNTGHGSYKLKLTKGQTIWLAYNGLNKATNTLTFGDDAAAKMALNEVLPAAGSTVMCTNTRQIAFRFNNPVACSRVEFINGNYTKRLDAQMSKSSILLDIKETFYKFMKENNLKEGDEFTIRLSGVRSAEDAENILGTDGVLETKFICGAKPVALLSEGNYSNDHKFLSFWPTGTPDGIFTLQFDGDLQVPTAEGYNTTAQLTYGDMSTEAAERYMENLDIKIEGSKLTIDLTGKDRTPYKMLGSNALYDNILFAISHVRDAEGYPVYSSGSGSIGSFTRSMPYELVSVEANTEFTPANGESLKGVDNLEVFATDYKKFSFSGVKFTYTVNKETKSVVVTNYTATADDAIEGAYTINIPVPAEVKAGASNVMVSFENLVAADGKDHSAKFSAIYDGFTITSAIYQADSESAAIEWAGADIPVLKSGALLKFAINQDTEHVGYMNYTITDLNPNEGDDAMIATTASILYNEETGEWESEIYGLNNTKTYLGHTYVVKVNAYETRADFDRYHNDPVGTASFTFNGSSEPYVYSDVKLASISPEDFNITDAKDFRIVAKFDGLVKVIEGVTCIAGGAASDDAPFTLTPTDPDEEGYSDEWTLTLEDYLLAQQTSQQITVNIAAEDQDGHRVQGNYRKEENSLFQYTFTLSYQGAELSLVSPEETVDSLKEFVVECEKPLNISGYVADSEVVVYGNRKSFAFASIEPVYAKEIQEVIDYMNSHSVQETIEKFGNDRYYEAMNTPATQMKLTLKETITEPGEYTLHIPADYFCAGEQFDSENTKEFNASFTIEEAVEPIVCELVTDPKNGSTVASLQHIVLTFKGVNEVATGSGMISVKKDGEEIDRIDAEIDFDLGLNQMVINLANALTEQGIYTFDIPAGYFLNENGDELPAFTLTYGIGVETGINQVTTLNAAANKIYTLSGLRVNGKLVPGVYIINGKKVIVK